MTLHTLRWRSMLSFIAVMTAVITGGAVLAGALVPEEPRLDTPIVLDGEVWDVEQVGSAVVVAGNFTRVQTTRNGPTINQAGIFAYDMDSGILLDDFLPTLTANNGVEVRDVEPAADGRSVYIAGKFTAIDDKTDGRVRTRNRLAKLDVTTGRLDRNFAQAGVDAKVLSIDLVGDRLYVGGNFRAVYDIAPGRPPIEQAVRGLARFDATTGQFDTGFRFESRQDAGRVVDGVPTFGVAIVAATPNGRFLAIAHRGEELFDATNNVTYRRPGIALLDISNPNQPAVTGFETRYTDPNDPNQDFYWAGQCGRGIQIRDLDISPDGTYMVAVHQGADRGVQCDTAVRWPIVTQPTRPSWVSRAFDSIFSVAIADDAVYLGGHFRYLVSPDAPSPYPGQGSPQNGWVGGGEIYFASPNQNNFRQDLLEPGYVYRAFQMGALNPATGYGITSFNPGSDAFKGVLALTVVDRGLLIGQDRGRINGFNTGRAAFLDLSPNVGDPACRTEVQPNGDVVVSWTNIGNVNEWRIARNGQFLNGTNGTSFTDTTAPVDQDLSYELRFNRNGVSQTDGCGTVRVDQIPLSCLAEVEGQNTITVDWNNVNSDRYTIRRDGVFLDNIDDRTRLQDNGLTPGATYVYEVWAVDQGEVTQSATCTATTEGAVVICTVQANGGTVTVDFNGDAFGRVTIRRDGAWQATVSDQNSYRQTVEPGTYDYTVRGVLNGFRTEADCGTVTVDPPAVAVLVCEVERNDNLVVVSWNDVGASSYQVRVDDRWRATVNGTEWSDTNVDGSIQIRYRLNGERTTVTCA